MPSGNTEGQIYLLTLTFFFNIMLAELKDTEFKHY
jgi:hypothetical protein